MVLSRTWLCLCASLVAGAPAAGWNSAASPAVSLLGDSAEYRVVFSERNRRVVRVEAELTMRGNRIGMSPIGAIGLDDGWSHYIEDLSLVDERGRSVAMVRLSRSTWRISGRRRGRLWLAYTVRLDHDRRKWSFGVDEASYLRDDCTYLATSAVFIAPHGLTDASVRFELPPGWIVSTSWTPVPGEDETYRAADFEQLTRSCVLVGEHIERKVNVAGADWLVAVGGELAPSVRFLERAAFEAALIFGEVPGRRYVLIANLGDYSGGSGHVGGMSMVLERRPAESGVTWAHILAHELLHMWNGVAIRRTSHREEWFAEGVTDYLALLLLARTGVLSPQAAVERLARSYDMYRGEAGGLSLIAAGREKLEHFELLYGGGLMMGLLLDVEIRYGSHGRHTIDDLLRNLYDEFGDGRESCRSEDVIGVASDLADLDLEKLFRRYVSGERVIPVAAYLRRLGLALEEGRRGRAARVLDHPESTARQEHLRADIFGGQPTRGSPSVAQDQVRGGR